MERKRKAAANVFIEQQVAQEAEERSQFAASPAPMDSLAEPVAALAAAGAAPQAARRVRAPVQPEGLKTSEELQLEKEPIRVRETGFWPFKRVIVPPNVYVVHTRLGRLDPVTIGLGLSFRFNPNTDAYLVVPAAMQTIGIVAYCISKEKQGINILAYVQWQIQDFSVAYRKLDFSDWRDPLGIVNAQLREQAEAAIKDKIATMSVEEVLTDKEPIIEELTARLKTVAEGRDSAAGALDGGLGIKIVTVQLKEALVSSQRLWENLQAPFRYEKEKAAKISHLTAQEEIRKKELETKQATETIEAETTVEIERIKQMKQTEAQSVRLTEESTRNAKQQQAERQAIQLTEETTMVRQQSEQRLQVETARIAQEQALAALRLAQEETLERTRLHAEAEAGKKRIDVDRLLAEIDEESRLRERQADAEQRRIAFETSIKTLESEYVLLASRYDAQIEGARLAAALDRNRTEALQRLELEESAGKVKAILAEREADVERMRQEIRNAIGENDLASRFVEKLPELAAHMPDIHELRVLQTGGSDQAAFDALAGFLARAMALGETLGISLPRTSARSEVNDDE